MTMYLVVVTLPFHGVSASLCWLIATATGDDDEAVAVVAVAIAAAISPILNNKRYQRECENQKKTEREIKNIDENR